MRKRRICPKDKMSKQIGLDFWGFGRENKERYSFVSGVLSFLFTSFTYHCFRMFICGLLCYITSGNNTSGLIWHIHLPVLNLSFSEIALLVYGLYLD